MFNVSCLRAKRRFSCSEPAFCCQRYGVLLIFDNAKVLHFHCGLRIHIQDYFVYFVFARSFGHLVICQNRKLTVKIRHYNINIYIYI